MYEAQKKYYAKNKEKVRKINLKSNAKTYISKYAKTSDLYELQECIAKKHKKLLKK